MSLRSRFLSLAIALTLGLGWFGTAPFSAPFDWMWPN
jgi:hypothetical protein